MTDEPHPHCKSGCAASRLEERAKAAEVENRLLRRQVGLLRQQFREKVRAAVKEELAKIAKEG